MSPASLLFCLSAFLLLLPLLQLGQPGPSSEQETGISLIEGGGWGHGAPQQSLFFSLSLSFFFKVGMWDCAEVIQLIFWSPHTWNYIIHPISVNRQLLLIRVVRGAGIHPRSERLEKSLDRPFSVCLCKIKMKIRIRLSKQTFFLFVFFFFRANRDWTDWQTTLFYVNMYFNLSGYYGFDIWFTSLPWNCFGLVVFL